MSIITKLENFVSEVFKTTLEIFLKALKLSPNAQGYVSGSITELLLKEHLESLGYTVERIRENGKGENITIIMETFILKINMVIGSF